MKDRAGKASDPLPLCSQYVYSCRLESSDATGFPDKGEISYNAANDPERVSPLPDLLFECPQDQSGKLRFYLSPAGRSLRNKALYFRDCSSQFF